jgi:hypothetical protein
MVDNLYKQYKLHANIASSSVAKIGMSLAGKATMQDFLPFADDNSDNKKIPMSKETAQIYIELRSQNLIPVRVLGAFADIEIQIEELAA